MPRLLVTIRGDRRQIDFAALVGLTQSKLSRLEKGEGPPLAPDEAAAFAAVAGATPEQAARLVELAEIHSATHQVPRAVMMRNAHVIQARIRDLIRAADHVWSWSTDAVPSMLQTREWTEAMLASEGAAGISPDWWTAREAHAELLADPARSCRLLLSEGALRWILGSRTVQAALVEHITEVSHLDHVEIGVLDLATPKPFVAAYSFALYGEHAAEVDSDLGAAFTTHPDDLAYFRSRFERLWAHAHHGDQARELLGRIARAVRR
jgi:hypothetical protein